MHFGFVEKGYPGPSGGGGAGTFVQIVGRYLVRQGHRVTVIARTQADVSSEEDDLGVRVHRIPVAGSRAMTLLRLPVLRGFRHVAGYLHQGRIVAHFIDRSHGRDPFDLIEFSEGGDFWHRNRHGFKVVSHLHGSRYTFLKESGRPVEAADWRQRKLELAFIRRADWVLSPSRALAGIVQEESGSRFRNLTVRPYPLDVISASAVERSESEGAMRVVFAARNDPVKGGDVLLNAVREIENSGGGVQFDFYGYLPKPGQSVPDSVKIHGFIPRDTLLKNYGRADVAVVPSFWDNSPNTVYEAMAASLPVVGSVVGGIPELIRDEETGYLVEARDWRSIAQRLLQLRDDPELRERMGRAARKRIMALADPEPNLEARLGVYREIISGDLVSPQPETP